MGVGYVEAVGYMQGKERWERREGCAVLVLLICKSYGGMWAVMLGMYTLYMGLTSVGAIFIQEKKRQVNVRQSMLDQSQHAKSFYAARTKT